MTVEGQPEEAVPAAPPDAAGERFVATLFSFVAIGLGSVIGTGVYTHCSSRSFNGRAPWPM